MEVLDSHHKLILLAIPTKYVPRIVKSQILKLIDQQVKQPNQFQSVIWPDLMMKVLAKNDILIPFPIRTLDFGAKGGEKLNTMLTNREGSGSANI